MAVTLYRKYRPGVFEDVWGQDHIVRTLQGALLSGHVGHAYLFCGPRGTGKTTLARLFAKTLNCEKRKENVQLIKKAVEPCNICSSCLAVNENRSLDLIEIDAASHTGVDNVRELNDSARVAASSSRYKIFIIDEVHMLSKSAFNALLKTLEEPPAHVIFILATTEFHKVPETILSRVQRFDFKKIPMLKIEEKLKKIAASEKITIDDGAISVLAAHAGGSFRDAESAMAKLMSFAGSHITVLQASEIFGLVPIEIHDKFLSALENNNGAAALALITDLHESGIDLENFTRQFISHVRNVLLVSVSKPVVSDTSHGPERLVAILNIFLKARTEQKNSPVPQLPLELAILELTAKK